MADDNVRIPPDSTGKLIDTYAVDGEHRQVVILGGTGATAERVVVTSSSPVGTEYALVVRNASVTPGTNAGNLGKAVDSIAGNTDTGVAMLTVRDDALTTITPVEGDYARLFVNSVGALWVQLYGGTITSITNALPAGTNNIGDVDIASALPAGTNTIGSVQLTDGTETALITPTGDLNVQINQPLPAGTNNIGSVTVDAVEVDLDHTTDSIAIGDGTSNIMAVSASGELSIQITQSLPAGTNNIGDVDIVSDPPLTQATDSVAVGDGTDTIAVSDTGEVSVAVTQPLPAGSNTIGTVHVDTISLSHTNDSVAIGDGTELVAVSPAGALSVELAAALPAGTNNIGDVDVASLPALPTGTNTIGSIQLTDGVETASISTSNALYVTHFGSLPSGDNNIGNVDVLTLPSLPAGTNNIGDVDIASALPAGDNNIGNVDVLTLPSLPAGSNNIGDVDVLSVIPGTASNSLGKAVDAVAPATGTGVASLAVRTDTLSPLTPANGDFVYIRTNNLGALHTTVTTVVPGTSATHLGKAVDAAHGGTDTGVASLVVRDDALATLTPADNDYTVLRVGSTGALWAQLAAALPAGTNNIGDVDVITLPSLPAGTNDIGSFHITNGTYELEITSAGAITVDSITSELPAGTQNIGDVDIVSLPSLPAGTNNIGDVDLASAIPAGDNAIGRVKITDGTYVAAVNASNQLEVNAAVDVDLDHTTDSVAIGDGTSNIASVSAAGDLSVEVAQPLPAGTNNIGDVDIASALPAGTNNIGDVDVVTLPALSAGSNDIGSIHVVNSGNELAITAAGAITVNSITSELPAGTQNIGDVDVATLPSLPAGSNNIGDVDVASLPALPAGTNDIGSFHVTDGTHDLDITAAGAIVVDSITNELPAGTQNIGDVDIASALPTGDNNIGNVDVVTLPALPAGTNNIGDVDIASALPTGSNTIGSIAAITTSITPGTSAAHLGKAVDSAAGGTDTGVAVLAIRDDALTTITPADGDYAPQRVDKTGALWVIQGIPGGASLVTYSDTKSSSGTNALFTPTGVANIVRILVSNGATQTDVSVWYGSSQSTSNTLARAQLAPYGGINDIFVPPYIPKTGSGEAVNLQLSAANSVAITVFYYES